MKLLTKELEQHLTKAFEENKSGTRTLDETTIWTKFFYPAGYATWFVTEYDPDERMFFGYACMLPGCGEWGWFSRDELEGFESKIGLGVERDLYYTPKKVKECEELKRFTD